MEAWPSDRDRMGSASNWACSCDLMGSKVADDGGEKMSIGDREELWEGCLGNEVTEYILVDGTAPRPCGWVWWTCTPVFELTAWGDSAFQPEAVWPAESLNVVEEYRLSERASLRAEMEGGSEEGGEERDDGWLPSGDK